VDSKTPSNSRLLKVIQSNGDDHMPPNDEPQLSKQELAILTQWISQGTPFDSRMAVLPKLPKVSGAAKTIRSPALTLAVAADGQTVFAGRFRSVDQRSAKTGNVVWSFQIPDGKVNDLQIAGDGQRLLLATGTPGLSGRAIEVAIGSSEVLREFAGHDDILYAARWSPDGSLVATAGYDRRIVLHDAHTGTRLRELTGHNGAVFDLDFSPDGSLLASASADATIKVWHVATGERFDTLSQPQAEQYSVDFSPDGRFIYGSGGDSRIRKWKLISRSSPQINPLLVSRFAHEGVITKMAISSDGRYLVTASENGSLKTWDAEKISELSASTFNHDLVSSLAFDDSSAEVLIATSQGVEQRIHPTSLPATMADGKAATSESMPTTNATAPLQDVAEAEPNNDLVSAQAVAFPVKIVGTIEGTDHSQPDIDLFKFDARRGQLVIVEVRADRDKSPLDSAVEVVDAVGQPVLQAQLQAVRDSYFTFRGKDSETSDDFRMFNWQEMDLNEYLYADGEVVKLWLYPRGPDSGFKVYPGFGNRQTYFNTTPTSHPLQGPAFIVVAYGPNEFLKDTGLPIFPVYAQNDDDPMRQWGRDSRLVFSPQADGTYFVRLKDAREFQGADFKYQLLIRSPQPDFSVEMTGNEQTLHRGTGRELSFTTTRLDGYAGPIEILAENLPAGFSLSDPVVIQEEQRQAFATLIASHDAVQPDPEAVAKIIFRAQALINGQKVVHDVGGLKSLTLRESPKILVRILADERHDDGQTESTPELTVWAGETVRAWLKVDRLDHTGLVEFGKEDSGRNMPHGVFVDNIGLNGLMLLEGQDKREFFITAAKWVPESSRPFYLKSNVDGGITSMPVILHIRHRSEEPPKTAAVE
jgi:WD40 repeat protein